ncbi:MAG TPA: ThuA domain-containing protein [Verrucomicrobiae bacterium]|nr:ThuA domain-containing protein [Verrucomicrobiae bacterium]
MLVIVVLVAAHLTASAAETNKIKILIVDGFSNHDWKQTTALIKGILQPTGLFDVSVSTTPATTNSPDWDKWRPKFSDYDVVIQTYNDLHGGAMWPREVQVAFENFVTNGGGFFDFHAANNSFAKWPAYNEMIGLGWRNKDFGWAITIDTNENLVRIPAGEGLGTSHGAQTNVVIHRLGEHPIHAGFPRSWQTPHLEVYYYARGPAKNIEVLSYGFDPHTRMYWPTEWTVTYGKGRVYSATFGHVWKGDVQPEAMRCAGVQTVMVRALQWLAKRSVDYPVPPDFPAADKLSIRPEIPMDVPVKN